MVRRLITLLYQGKWETIARLLQLACLSLGVKPILAHEFAAAGGTGVLLGEREAALHRAWLLVWRVRSISAQGYSAAVVAAGQGPLNGRFFFDADILQQAPRHHRSWRPLSVAATSLLAALVRCEGATEAAQPQVSRGAALHRAGLQTTGSS